MVMSKISGLNLYNTCFPPRMAPTIESTIAPTIESTIAPTIESTVLWDAKHSTPRAAKQGIRARDFNSILHLGKKIAPKALKHPTIKKAKKEIAPTELWDASHPEEKIKKKIEKKIAPTALWRASHPTDPPFYFSMTCKNDAILFTPIVV
jgi:hypothetical protein